MKRRAGKKIKEFRLAKGLTQTELAEMSGVSAAGLSYIESGQRSPTEDTLNKIALALGLPPAIFLS